MHIRINDFHARKASRGRHLSGDPKSQWRSWSIQFGQGCRVKAHKEGFLHTEQVTGSDLGDEFVRALSEREDRDLRIRVQLDDPVQRDPGLRVLLDLLDAVGPLAALRGDTTSTTSSRSDA
jgi:hypothetical protein